MSISSENISFGTQHYSTAIPEHLIGIWFTQAHSCQRDLILAAKQANFPQPVHVIASHGDLRPEITSVADIALQEPPLDERVDWVLSQAQQMNVKLIIAGRYGSLYLAEKHRFEQAGIRLMAGSTDEQFIEQLHDKSVFTEICLANGLPVVPATTVYDADQLQAAYDHWSTLGAVCVKPVKGVFASGFWYLDPQTTPFAAFANSQNFRAHPQTFIESYRSLPEPPAYLVMPYLSASECSVDMFCADGKVHQAIARYKHKGGYQQLHLNDPAIELAKQLVEIFKCDGLVNMQARYNGEGQLFILEINPRPSGGISNTFFSGINVVEAAIAYAFDWPYTPEVVTGDVSVRSISQTIRVDIPN